MQSFLRVSALAAICFHSRPSPTRDIAPSHRTAFPRSTVADRPGEKLAPRDGTAKAAEGEVTSEALTCGVVVVHLPIVTSVMLWLRQAGSDSEDDSEKGAWRFMPATRQTMPENADHQGA